VRVVVICGAGASSTFLAHRMTRLAATRGVDIDVSPGSVDSLDRLLPGPDVILVGSHLSAAFPAIREVAESARAQAALLPEIRFDDEGAALALDLATDLDRTGAASDPSVPISNSTIDQGSPRG
jgi:cellobiose PTS system EIIB component